MSGTRILNALGLGLILKNVYQRYKEEQKKEQDQNQNISDFGYERYTISTEEVQSPVPLAPGLTVTTTRPVTALRTKTNNPPVPSQDQSASDQDQPSPRFPR